MPSENPFKLEGNWYKGNLHTHTTQSDADLSPAAMADVYRQAGYDFLCITDHNRVTDVEPLSSEGFLVIPGDELAVSLGEGYCELVALNIPHEPGTTLKSPAHEAIRAVREMGGELVLPHPYDLALGDILGLDGILGLEVYNHSVHMNVKRGYAAFHWDALLARGKRLWGFATDDAHYHFNDHRPSDVCGGWIMVKAPALTAEGLLDSIRRGLFYASNGPGIEELTITDESVMVRTAEPCRSINFVGPSWGTSESFTPIDGSLISEAEFELRDDQAYVRVECVTPEGQMAWANPLWLGEPSRSE